MSTLPSTTKSRYSPTNNDSSSAKYRSPVAYTSEMLSVLRSRMEANIEDSPNLFFFRKEKHFCNGKKNRSFLITTLFDCVRDDLDNNKIFFSLSGNDFKGFSSIVNNCMRKWGGESGYVSLYLPYSTFPKNTFC